MGHPGVYCDRLGWNVCASGAKARALQGGHAALKRRSFTW